VRLTDAQVAAVAELEREHGRAETDTVEDYYAAFSMGPLPGFYPDDLVVEYGWGEYANVAILDTAGRDLSRVSRPD
jgi:hypothetical protein